MPHPILPTSLEGYLLDKYRAPPTGRRRARLPRSPWVCLPSHGLLLLIQRNPAFQRGVRVLNPPSMPRSQLGPANVRFCINTAAYIQFERHTPKLQHQTEPSSLTPPGKRCKYNGTEDRASVPGLPSHEVGLAGVVHTPNDLTEAHVHTLPSSTCTSGRTGMRHE